MNLISSPIDERTTSGYPISIATSLAIETLFEPRQTPYDPSRTLPPRPDINKYNSIYINIDTLLRNISSSMDKNDFIMTSVNKIARVLEQEMEVIDSVFNIEGKNIIKPIYYSMTYKAFYKEASKKLIEIRKPKSDYQKQHDYISLKIKESFRNNDKVLSLDSTLNPDKFSKSLILTHIPLDLLNYTKFTLLDLLESNTGKVKTRFEWNTKYMKVGGGNVNILPFNRKLLFIFGDKVMIKPINIKIRRTILDIAESMNWTPATTTDKINLDLKLKLLDPVANSYIQSL